MPTPQNPTDAANKAYVDANAGGNLGAPPPIGNVTPNTVNATALTAQNSNGVLNAATYSGSDACARMNAATTAAVAAGMSVVSGEGFVGNQACAATMTIAPKIHYILPAGTWTFNGSPGISLSGPGATIECNGLFPNGVSPTRLQSGVAAPLIASYDVSFHGAGSADGLRIRGCELSGNNVGTFGVFIPGAYAADLSELDVHGFTAAGILSLGANTQLHNVNSHDNGGDGVVWGFDGNVDGYSAAGANGGTGWHVLSGGTAFIGIVAYHNGLHGFHGTSNYGSDWVASTTYVEPYIIQPTANNAGSYGFYSQAIGITGSSRPSFCQSAGCTTTDGSVKWINVGKLASYGGGPGSMIAQYWNKIVAPDITDNNYGNHAGDWDNILIEGNSGNPAFGAQITGPKVSQAEVPSYPQHGIHIKYAQQTEINGNVQWWGGAWPSTPQVDLGGVEVEHSDFTNIGGIQCNQSYSNCLQVVSSSDTVVGNLSSENGSVAATPLAGTYALSADSNSYRTLIQSMNALDYRGTQYQRGVSNQGTATVVRDQQYGALASSPDSGSYTVISINTGSGTLTENVPSAAGFSWNIGGAPQLSLTSNGATVNGDLSARDIPGALYFVSKYASIQAAINAAYNNGAVLGTVIDDRAAPYSGPGFILYDSVTLKLAATTYTITGTVTYNNGNNNVTAGIIAVPGARLIGASTSTNHGTIITAGNGLNADLIATSTVGTGAGSAAQWWHWGGFENLRVTGNGANQTTGNCFNIENMGETAFLRTIEVSGCKVDNILFTGASATPSDIANITTNSAGRYGFNFNNLSGVAVVHGLSGDSNATSIVRLNGGQSGTLTILGFKTEEEISGQDPLITIDQTGQGAAQPSLFIVGGYTFGRSGVNDVIKYVNGTLGTTPYISVSNFYVQDYANAVNDVVNSRTTAATNMNKVPFYYGPTGAFYSGQAFTLDLNTFVQSPHSGNYTLTEIFGTTSSNETLVAASGTSTSISTGGIGFRMANRSVYGQTPELFAKMTYAFPGGVPNTQQWEFIPAKVGGDNSTRWIGDPSYRWDEIYSADVNTTTATVGTLNVTTCNGCGSGVQQVNSDWNANSGVAQILNKPALAAVATSGSYTDLSNKPVIPVQGAHLVSGSMQGNSATLTGNSVDQTVYTAIVARRDVCGGDGSALQSAVAAHRQRQHRHHL